MVQPSKAAAAAAKQQQQQQQQPITTATATTADILTTNITGNLGVEWLDVNQLQLDNLVGLRHSSFGWKEVGDNISALAKIIQL